MNPRPSSRIKSLERRATDIEAAIEELAGDQAESNKALFTHIQKGFEQAHAYMKENIESVMATKEDISKLENEMSAMEGRIDGKMSAMESRINQNIADLKTGLLEALRDMKQGS